MNTSNNTREASQNRWLYFLMFIQAVIIIVFFCVWKWETILNWVKQTIWPWIAETMWPWIKGHTDSTLFVTLVATVIGALIVRWGIKLVTILRFETREYITFEADFTQVFRLSEKVSNLEYSVGEKKWKKLGTDNIVFGGNRGKLLLRGWNKKGTEGATITFATDAQVICTGDIRTLVNYKHYNHAKTKKAVFDFLFAECRQLVVAPELPATELADRCYSYMFYGCTSLKTAPKLPALNLAHYCYDSMFLGCTSLKIAPILPATELVLYCYNSMFYGCTSLSRITMMAVETTASLSTTDHWLDNTSPKGIFLKNKNATWNNTDINPPGWEVVLVDPKWYIDDPEEYKFY